MASSAMCTPHSPPTSPPPSWCASNKGTSERPRASMTRPHTANSPQSSPAESALDRRKTKGRARIAARTAQGTLLHQHTDLVRSTSLLRAHTDGAVETDHLTVEHHVLDDVHGQCAVFIRLAQPRRVRHLAAERFLRLRGKPCHHGCFEDSRRDGGNADEMASQLASDRQRHG